MQLFTYIFEILISIDFSFIDLLTVEEVFLGGGEEEERELEQELGGGIVKEVGVDSRRKS